MVLKHVDLLFFSFMDVFQFMEVNVVTWDYFLKMLIQYFIIWMKRNMHYIFCFCMVALEGWKFWLLFSHLQERSHLYAKNVANPLLARVSSIVTARDTHQKDLTHALIAVRASRCVTTSTSIRKHTRELSSGSVSSVQRCFRNRSYWK